MKRFITLSILTLTVSGILNAGTVKVGDQIKIDIPGSKKMEIRNIPKKNLPVIKL